MGAHLGWEPDEPQPLGGSLSTSMKHALADRLTNGDTTAVQDGGVTLDETDVDWLKGVMAGRDEGSDLYDDAVELLAGIRQYKRIRLVRI